jgi:hypothetical protein
MFRGAGLERWYCQAMNIVIAARDPQALADLIDATLYGRPANEELTCVGKIVRDEQEADEDRRSPWDALATVDFKKLDDDHDWSDV